MADGRKDERAGPGRFRLRIAYLGGAFAGWQRQPDVRTVQAVVEGALATVCGASTPLTGAGRTDAGVHAAGQVAHADIPISIPEDGLVKALNAALPGDVRVLRATRVRARFHARYDACAKLYVYRTCAPGPAPPWQTLRRTPTSAPVQMHDLLEAASALEGRHDFASFTVPEVAARSTERTLFRVRVTTSSASGLRFSFFGDGFLRYQVRRMVGALLEVGSGSRSTAELARLIDTPSAGAHVWTAPACGLTLERVLYPLDGHEKGRTL